MKAPAIKAIKPSLRAVAAASERNGDGAGDKAGIAIAGRKSRSR